ncbi:putative tRNA pseudouridine synthase D [uncultured archaeon]|nr:putative tRNA pseudouridine synthase D [uncultured archaeon]
MSALSFSLKSLPRDFIVEEITPEKEVLALDKLYSFDEKSAGKFLQFILQKENRDTLEVLDEIARKLHVTRETLSIAGMKDKEAITSQSASAYRVKKEQLEKIKIRGVKLIPVQYSDKKSFLGNLWGNRFEITARDIDMEKDRLKEFIESRIQEMHGVFPNYFGEQRFGEDNSTQKIGKLILKREFKTAALECTKRYRECATYLKKHPKDHVGAIKQLPIKLQKLFIHAVQAEIFNSALDELVNKGKFDKNIEIPLPGYRFSSRIFTSEIDKIVEETLKENGLSPEMFRVKELPEISSEGELRRAFEEFHEFKILAIEADEIHSGKTKAVLQFSLKKGCYATVFLDRVFKK